jgi:toxin-antitoxin system PIN domain toxin
LLGFVRISTSARIFQKPLSTEEALEVVSGWLALPNVIALSPGPNHWSILRSLLRGRRNAGVLSTDAHLAALAVEHGCELCSADRDFARFAGLHWTDPL